MATIETQVPRAARFGPPPQFDRSAVVERRLSGMFPAEIAQDIGASRSTVTRILTRAGVRVAPTSQERFWRQVEKTPSCWLWTGQAVKDGYGRVRIDGRNRAAHRVSYEWLVGPIPDGLTLDHLCSNPPCVNPAHLDPVTIRVNVLRSTGITAMNIRKQRCQQGHPFNEENTYVPPDGGRGCRTCRREARRNHAARQRALRVGVGS